MNCETVSYFQIHFNLHTDPLEMKPLAPDEKYKSIVANPSISFLWGQMSEARHARD